MRLEQSDYLISCKEKVKQLISLLSKDYEYVSVLANDVSGSTYVYSQRNQSVRPYQFAEKGFVARVYTNKGYQEYSFNDIENVDELANKIKKSLKQQDSIFDELNINKYKTPVVHEEKIIKEFAGEVSESVTNIDSKEMLKTLKKISDEMVKKEHIVESNCQFTVVKVCKMFESNDKDLIQSYGFSLASTSIIANMNDETKFSFASASGFKGIELIDEIKEKLEECYQDLISLFTAENLEPGEYTVICPPETAGIIAHEAFGHGLEMDMFVKNRAVAKNHMQEKIGSSIANMYDGATVIKDTASYFFDDEGTISSTTQILNGGYLVAGMSDLLSALRLNTTPTGNGRRESYKRKAYTRMTNTYFSTGENTLDEMISATDYGFIIDHAQSGMEDPKNWGIQCVLTTAREIKDGKLTGKVFTPVILTGYVPDLLANIDMAGKEITTDGCGYCGKGYKEWVVVSDGGPYIRTKVRLG